MWSIEKFGGVSSRGRQAALRPSTFSNPEGLRGRRMSHLGLIVGLFLNGFCEEFRPFLTGSAPQTKIDATLSKQTTKKFLTEARTPIKLSSNWPNFCPNFFHAPRVADHGSRLLPATSLSLALTQEGSLACRSFRYNAACPNFSREACNPT